MTRVVKALLLSGEKNLRVGTNMALPGGHGYTQQTLDRICRDNGIEERFRIPLAEQLEAALFVYNNRTGNRAGRLNNRKIKSRLVKIKRQAAKLKNELERMHPQVFRECMATYRELREEEMGKGAESRIRRAGIETRLPGEFEDFKKIPAILELVCGAASRRILPDTAGKNPDDPLYVWVKMMSDFWIHVLGREYKLYIYEGIPKSEAGRFLEDCMSPLDSAAVSRLPTQIRRYFESLSSGVR